MATATLKAVLIGQDKSMSSTFDKAGGSAEGLGGKLKKVGPMAAAGAAAVVAGGVLAGKALYDIGSQFDSMSDTIRVGTGATGDALDDLNESAKTVGKTTPASFDDIGVAIADLNTRLGLTGAPLEDMSKQFLNLSRITGTDLSSNIEGITRVFGDWGIATEDQADSLDKIFRASQATGAGVDSLSNNVVKFGAPMRQLGFSFEETLGLLGKFEKEGVNTELVMGSMRIALGKMARAGEEPVETLARMTEQIKNAGSEGEANALALELFGARAGPDMAAAIREGRFELGDLLGLIEDGSETINQASQDTMDWSEQWQMFKNNALIAIEPIASGVFDLMGKFGAWLVEKGAPAIERFSGWFTNSLWPALKQGKDTLMPGVKKALDILSGGVGDGQMSWEKFGKVITDKVIPFLAQLFNVYLPAAATQIRMTIEAVKLAWRAFETWRDVVLRVVSRILEAFSSIARTWAGLLRALSKVPGFGWAADAANKLDGAADQADRLVSGIRRLNSKTITITTRFLQVGNPSPGTLKGIRQAYATGGPAIAGRSYLVGENGPEIFTPGTSGSVTDARNSAKVLSGRGGRSSSGGGGGYDGPDRIVLEVDGRVLHEVLLRQKKQSGMELGLA